MISSDQIVSATPIAFERRVPDGETEKRLFVTFNHPLTNQAISIQVSIWEQDLQEYDWGYQKSSNSNLVIAASLAEVKPQSGANTWTIFLLKKIEHSSEGQGWKHEDVNHELLSINLSLSVQDTQANFSSMYGAGSESSSKTALAQFEKFLGADLNKDGKIGPVFAVDQQPDDSDSAGLRFIRDTEGTAYIFKADGNHTYLQSNESEQVWNGGWGGWQKKIIAIEKGDPLQYAAQKAFDSYLLKLGRSLSDATDDELQAAFLAGVDQAVKLAFAFNYSWQWGHVPFNDKTAEPPTQTSMPMSKLFEDYYKHLNAAVTNKGSAGFGKFDPYKALDRVTKDSTGLKYEVTSAGAWGDYADDIWVVYQEGSFNLVDSNKVPNASDQRFSVDRIDSETGRIVQSWYEAPVSWLEGFFGQNLNNSTVVGAGLVIFAKDELLGVGDVDRSKMAVAKDADGKYYLLTPKSENADITKLDTYNLFRLDSWVAGRLWDDSATRKAGKEPLTVFQAKDANNQISNYLVAKSFEKTKSGNDWKERIESIEIYAIAFGENGLPSVTQSRSVWLNEWNKGDLLQLESDYNRDFNGDGTVGKGNPRVVEWLDALTPGSNSNPDAVLATNAAGEVFILYKNTEAGVNTPLTGYSVLGGGEIKDAWGSALRLAQSTSWETKTPVAVVKTSLQSIKDASDANTWFPWGNSTSTGNSYSSDSSGIESLKLTDQAYFIAVKTENNGAISGWQIYIVNESNGRSDWSSLWVNRISGFETVFGQDLNFDGAVGVPVPVEIEGPDKSGEFKSTDSVRALVDSEGRIFIKDYDEGVNANLMPVLNQWGGDAPQWQSQYSWDNWGPNGTYRVTRKAEVIGATKEIDKSGNVTYLVAVRESETSLSQDFTPTVRWQIHRLTPNDKNKKKVENSDPVYQAAAIAFYAAIADGVSDLAAFDQAAAAARVVAIEQGESAVTIDQEIEAARTYFTASLAEGKTAEKAFELIFDDSDDVQNSSSGQGVSGYPMAGSGGMYYPAPNTPNITLPENALLYNGWTDHTKSVSDREVLFKQDLNGDKTIGISADNLRLVSTDTAGLRLARETGGGLYIVEVDANRVATEASKAITSFKLISGNDWLESSWTWMDGYNKREAFAVAAEREGLKIVGYQLLIRSENKWGGQEKAAVSWDIYALDSDARLTWGRWDESTNMWKDSNVYGVSSIKPYEQMFGQDLDGDGKIGLSLEDLTYESRDTWGARLARDNTNALYIVLPDSQKTIVALKNASWLEYRNDWGWGSKESKVAIAAEEAFGADGTTKTGYWLALERSSQWGSGQSERITYEILRVDLEGQVTWGYWDQPSNRWIDESVYDAPSLAPYEERFKQDFNGDGFIGIDPATLDWDPRDTTGIRLARDKDKALYVLTVASDGVTATKASAIKGANWLEYDSGWGSKREAVAVEAASDGSGYWMALKNTSTFWDWQTNANKTQITWDVYKLDADARVTWGNYVGNQWVDESIYGAKSIAAYEDRFKQDLNGDGRIGIDIASLTVAPTDTVGVRLARDGDGAVFFITDFGDPAKQKATPVADGWLEYDYSSGDWLSKREAVAIEAKGDGYILAMKNTNTQWDGATYQVKTSWDVMKLSATGKTLHGYWDSETQMWIEQSEWGTSIANYERDFGQDLNQDGSIGIDLSNLERVATDTSPDSGVRLYRDRKDSVIYIANANQAVPIRNSSWMEYNNGWGEWSNSRTVIAAEQSGLDSAGKPLYKVVLRVENKWATGSDTNWEVITVNSEGRQLWGEGSSLWTNRTKIVESLVNEDLNADGSIGPRPADIRRVASDTQNPFLETDISDSSLYIRDTSIQDQSSLIPILDKYGTPAELSRDVTWGQMVVSYRPWAVTRVEEDGVLVGYKLLVRVEKSNSNVPTWELYSVTAGGVIDLFNIRSSKSADRYEREFNQDFDGNGTIGPVRVNPVLELLDTGPSVIGRHTVNGEVIGLYIVENSLNNVLLTTRSGAMPNIEVSSNLVSARAVASHKLDLGSGKAAFKVAVKREVGEGVSKNVSWEVYHFDLLSSGDEAVLDRSKTLFFDDSAVRSVEILVNQNLEENDNGIGYPEPKPIAVQVSIGSGLSTDVGLVQAGIDPANGWLYIMTASSTQGQNPTYLEVKLPSGAHANLESSTTFQESRGNQSLVTTIREEVFAATAVMKAGQTNVVDSYRVLVRELTTQERTVGSGNANSPSVTEKYNWKLYTVSSEGVLDLNFVQASNPSRWSTMFSEDLNGDGRIDPNTEAQSFGVAASVLRDFRGIRELRVSDDDLYIKDPLATGDVFVPILLPNQSTINFDFVESVGKGTLTSEVKYLVKQENSPDIYFMAVQRTYSQGEQSSTGFSVYTLDLKPDTLNASDRYAEIQLDKTFVTDDLSMFKDGNNAVFAGLESVA